MRPEDDVRTDVRNGASTDAPAEAPTDAPALRDRDDAGLLFACELDGAGGARTFGWDELDARWEGGGPVWIHLDAQAPRVHEWMARCSGVTEVTVAALLADTTRPRMFHGTRGTVTILRGVNTNANADPADMVGLRLWSDGTRTISLRKRPLLTPSDVLGQLLDTATGPEDAPRLYVRLIARLCERLTRTIDGYDDALDALELGLETAKASDTRRGLSELRQDLVLMRRYVAPQRDALQGLMSLPPAWLHGASLLQVREVADQVQRFVEDLDAARERSVLLKDDVTNRVAESTNRTLYTLSIVSAVFLPLGFLTGLLGMNVGGMPGVDAGGGFWIAVGLMLLLVALEIHLFRRLRWLE